MAGKNRLVVKKATNKQKYILIKGKNNETIATTETYKSDSGVKKGINALKKVVKNAVVVDKTKPIKKKVGK